MSLNNISSSLITPTLASFAACQVTGFLWYGPLFGKLWMKKMKEDDPTFDVHGSTPVLGAAVTWLTSSAMFSCLVSMTGAAKGAELVSLAGTAWLGFTVPGHVFAVLFEGRNVTVNVLGSAYILTSHLIMAGVHYLL